MIKNTCGQNGFKGGLYKKIAYVYPFLVQNQTHCAIAKRLKAARKISGGNEQKNALSHNQKQNAESRGESGDGYSAAVKDKFSPTYFVVVFF